MLTDFIKLLKNAKTPVEKQLAYQKLLRLGIDKTTADYMVKTFKEVEND